ncbi:MAG: universal stress protein [Bacteroidetes bacterium]|nr:universal stress protein [Bacteroidota bacterium]
MIHFKSGKILIPVDFSDTSLLAIKHGAFLAKYTKGDLYLLHVINKQYEHYAVVEQPMHIDGPEKFEQAATNKLNFLANQIKDEYGVTINTIVKMGNPTKEIIATEKEIGADMVVMGTHGYSPIEEFVIGSNTLKVITKGSVPVMTMSQKAKKFGYTNILLPIDTSGHSRQKVTYAIELAKTFSAHLHVAGILGADDVNEAAGMGVVMNQIKELAKKQNVIATSEILKDVKNRAKATIAQAEKTKSDLIIIMTDQEAEISGFFLGPYAQQVIHHSDIPVIAITPEQNTDSDVSIMSGTSGI